MLAVTGAVVGWTAASAEPARPAPVEEPAGLPQVRIISLADLEPWDTDPLAENNWGPDWGAEGAVDEGEMETLLAETTTYDGTIVRIYATADGLIDGAFSRPGEGWTRFVHLFRGGDVGPNFADGATLTPYENIMGHSGFLLRTDGYHLETYAYWYYWFDEAGALQVLRAYMDPAPMDLDGDGVQELAFNFDQFRNNFAFYCRSGGVLYQVPVTNTYGTLVGVEGEGPVRFCFSCTDADGNHYYETAAFTGETLRVERAEDYVPAEGAAPLPDLPQPAYVGRLKVSIAAPDGWVMNGGGEEVYNQIWYWLDNGGGPVLTRSGETLDHSRAFTVTLTDPETGAEVLTWTLDPNGLCRFSALEGTYRMERTEFGSPPAACYRLLDIYCAASRTSFDYDGEGRYLGTSLARQIAAAW